MANFNVVGKNLGAYKTPAYVYNNINFPGMVHEFVASGIAGALWSDSRGDVVFNGALAARAGDPIDNGDGTFTAGGTMAKDTGSFFTPTINKVSVVTFDFEWVLGGNGTARTFEMGDGDDTGPGVHWKEADISQHTSDDLGANFTRFTAGSSLMVGRYILGIYTDYATPDNSRNYIYSSGAATPESGGLFSADFGFENPPSSYKTDPDTATRIGASMANSYALRVYEFDPLQMTIPVFEAGLKDEILNPGNGASILWEGLT